jgi:hypothetical protein
MDRDRQDWNMSTQRREVRSSLAMKIFRIAARLGLRLFRGKGRAGRSEANFCCLPAQNLASDIVSRKAPPEGPECAATDSLQMDHTDQQPVRLVLQDIRRGSPSLAQAVARIQLGYRSPGSPPIHFPVVSSRLHRALPCAPAAQCCRTERYDGKRDLYFQHAA